MNQQLKSLLYIIDENNESDDFYEIWENLENSFSTKKKLNADEIDYLVSELSNIKNFTDGMYLLSDWVYESGIDYSFVFNLSKQRINHSAWTDLFQDAYFVKHCFMKSNNLPNFSPRLSFEEFVDELNPNKNIDIIEFEYLISVFDFENNKEKSRNTINDFAKKIFIFNNYKNYKEKLLKNPASNYKDVFCTIENICR